MLTTTTLKNLLWVYETSKHSQAKVVKMLKGKLTLADSTKDLEAKAAICRDVRVMLRGLNNGTHGASKPSNNSLLASR